MFNSLIMQRWSQPYHQGLPDEVLLIGQYGFPGEGPYMKIALDLEKQTILSAWFETYSCPAAIACGSWAAQWLEGKTVDQAASITAEEVSQMQGGLPLGKDHCARITVKALESALAQLEMAHVKSSSGSIN